MRALDSLCGSWCMCGMVCCFLPKAQCYDHTHSCMEVVQARCKLLFIHSNMKGRNKVSPFVVLKNW